MSPNSRRKTRGEVCWGVSGRLPKKSCKKELVPLLPLDIVKPGCDNGDSWSHLAASRKMKVVRKGGHRELEP